MPGSLRAVRLTAACMVAAALAAGTLAAAGGANADDTFTPALTDVSLSPGTGWSVGNGYYGLPGDGTVVYAFSKNPLTDPAWAGGGLPTGLSVTAGNTDCTAYPGTAGIYTCSVTRDTPVTGPTVNAADSAANHTTAYAGAAYAPRGTDVATAVAAAELAGTTSTPDRKTAGEITVLTAAEAALSTVRLTTPDVPAASSVAQTVHVHAADPAHLSVSFSPSEDQRLNDLGEIDVRVTGIDGPAGACNATFNVAGSGVSARCQLPAGDFTVSYTLTAGPDVAAWKLDAEAVLQVVDHGNVVNPVAHSTFKVLSPTPVPERYRLFGRTTDVYGSTYVYDGTGREATPFAPRTYYDAEPTFNAETALSGLTEHGTGDVVGRDADGILWYLRGNGTRNRDIFASPAKVGAGWNGYNSIVGARDLTGDSRADLVARDASGILWLYKGTFSTTAPFAARTKIGAGWNIYKTLTGAGDLTGDGRADMLAIDTSGTLWLYKGTGNAAAPYAARVKAGTGWNIYNVLLAPGDLTSDDRTDLVARDASGTLWLYKGAGNPATPVQTPRTKIGGGWNTYSVMF